ncbi:TPA: TIGR03759 family integrating conjugative element protein [Salmonella enterica]|uniref:TIGR03759 family integrating conjugative element protein n=1 Tax=Salmonella enterica TaxID=28901 RepID=A0A744HFS9_SALER|nr:TIGR03759 family integrating conjugative element protein [Salmonella enterica]HAF4919936.1 TIGR03759 family integrating conjugative element protein [Salmonella enterica]
MSDSPSILRCQAWVVFLACGLTLSGSAALAQSQYPATSTAETRHSPMQPNTLTSHDQHLANEWGLSPEDWTRYRELMQGPLGTYSPNLDPFTALGIEARSDEERRRFADLQVQAEASRTEKILSYQRAYDAAWQRAFPDAQRISLPDARVSTVSGNGRLALFVRENCDPCDVRARELQAAGSPFDIYMVGSRQDDSRLRQWAARVGIDPEKVRNRTITLNHDAGRWVTLRLPGELPAVARKVNGQWIQQ